MKIRPIVAATDGSVESLRAVEWAACEAVRHAAPLRIVSAASLPPRMTGLQVRPNATTSPISSGPNATGPWTPRRPGPPGRVPAW